jgi:hypothetical protein
VRKRNPWIQKRDKSLGDFSFPKTLSFLLMSYGVYCLINWFSELVANIGSPKHSG